MLDCDSNQLSFYFLFPPHFSKPISTYFVVEISEKVLIYSALFWTSTGGNQR